jgi:hypothetical protein
VVVQAVEVQRQAIWVTEETGDLDSVVHLILEAQEAEQEEMHQQLQVD